MAHLGHALVGDPLYAGRQWRNLAEPQVQAACRSFARQALHAWRLELQHPITAEQLAFEAPLPEDMGELIAAVRGRR
jgi:23S rRNA pseudouridine1911/1915/1917 synthase